MIKARTKTRTQTISYLRVGAVGPVIASEDKLDLECVSYYEVRIVWGWRLTAY